MSTLDPGVSHADALGARRASWGGRLYQSAIHHRTLRIALSSERRLFRDALAGCLARDPDFNLVGHVAGPEDLLKLCALSPPDTVVLDIGSRLSDGLDTLRALRSQLPHTRIVMAYEQLGPSELKTALRSGVDTLVPCSHGLDALLDILRRGRHAVDRPDAYLTEQDREILTLIGAGHPVGRIAALLGVSPASVENGKRRLYHKLDASGQSQAVARAAALGLIMQAPRVAIPADRPDGVMLALLCGQECLTHEYVLPALLAEGVPFVMTTKMLPHEVDRWDRAHAGPVLLVLVDPTPECWLRIQGRRLPIALVRTAPLDRAEMLEALDRGVSAVVVADQIPRDHLVSVLIQATRGHLVLAVSQAHTAVGAADALRGESRHTLPDLTVRESDILRSIASGHTVRQTARILGIAVKTVENTQARLFLKLGVHNRAAAFVAAHSFGLTESPRANTPSS